MVLEKDYDVLGVLGEGTFGKVYKASHRESGHLVAVKQIKLGSKSWDEALRSTELQALKALRHPFIVRLRELLRGPKDGSLYYVFEFIDSDLFRLLKKYPQGLGEARTADLGRQLFAGIAHMHQHNFFHRDMKPENVLLHSASESIRIADFGQARSLRARPPFTDYVGTRWYRAPECLLRDTRYSSPVDIWACGLIVAELVRGSPLFCGTSSLDQLFKIFQVLGQPMGDWPDFQKLAQGVRFRVPDRPGCGVQRVIPQPSAPLTALLNETMALNPRRRPLARKCLDHAFFMHLPPLDLDRCESRCSRGSPTPMPDDNDGKSLHSNLYEDEFESRAPPSAATTAHPVTEPAEASPEVCDPYDDDRPTHQVTSVAASASGTDVDLDLDAELAKILGDDPDSPKVTKPSAPAAMPSSLPAGLEASLPRPGGFSFGPSSRSPLAVKVPSRSVVSADPTSPGLRKGRSKQHGGEPDPCSPKGPSVDDLLDSLCDDFDVGLAPETSKQERTPQATRQTWVDPSPASQEAPLVHKMHFDDVIKPSPGPQMLEEPTSPCSSNFDDEVPLPGLSVEPEAPKMPLPQNPAPPSEPP